MTAPRTRLAMTRMPLNTPPVAADAYRSTTPSNISGTRIHASWDNLCTRRASSSDACFSLARAALHRAASMNPPKNTANGRSPASSSMTAPTTTTPVKSAIITAITNWLSRFRLMRTSRPSTITLAAPGRSTERSASHQKTRTKAMPTMNQSGGIFASPIRRRTSAGQTPRGSPRSR